MKRARKEIPTAYKPAEDSSDDDEPDAELEALLRQRLEAHCTQFFSESEEEEGSSQTADSEEAPHRQDAAEFGPANQKQKKRKTDNGSAQASLAPMKKPRNEELPGVSDSWASFLDTPPITPATTPGPGAKPANRNEVAVIDATKYSSNPIVRTAAQERKRFLSADALKIHGDDNSADSAKGRRRPKQPKETFREQLAREVEELGASTLTGKAKKEYAIKKIMELGGKAPKNLKTPLKILHGMKRKEGEREQKRKVEAIQTGMHVKKKDRRKPMDKKARGLDLTGHAGKFSGGVLRVKPSLIAKISKSKR